MTWPPGTRTEGRKPQVIGRPEDGAIEKEVTTVSRYIPSRKLTDEERRALCDPLNVGDVANLLGKSRRWVQEQTKAGHIPHARIGHTYRYSKAAIFEYAGITNA